MVAKASLDRWLLIPDCHVPYQDKAAFALMLRAAKVAGIKKAVILGDFMDFYSVSSHSKNPHRASLLQWEVDEGNAVFDVLGRAFEEVIFIEGNHEERLRRYLEDKASALFDTVRVERLFRFKERGWRYIPYKAFHKIGKLHITHDLGKAGKYAHYDAMASFQGNAIIGHTHRIGYAVEGSVGGKAHIGAMFGWLGDFSQVDYMHEARARRDWAHGFGLAYFEPDGCVHLVPIPLVNGKVVIEGKLVK